jgi:biotin carboxylase
MVADIILLGPKRHIIERAWQLGARPLIVQPPEHAEEWVQRQTERTLVMDYNDPLLIPMLSAAHSLTHFRCAITTTELGLLPCARINEALGLPGTPPAVVERTRNKQLMREALAARGFSVIRWAAVTTKEDAIAFAARNDYPFVLKPLDGVGSVGVRRVRSAADLERTFDGKTTWLAEEYLDGNEYSVESFSFRGRHVILAINEEVNNTDPSGNEFLELTHKIPAPMGKEQEREIRDFIRAFLDAIGIQDGPAHTELKYTSRGPRIIETHTRQGGDHLFDLVRLTTGLDPIDMTLQWALGTFSPPSQDPEPRGGAVIHYFTPPPGKLRRIHGVQALKRLPGVVDIALVVDLGDEIRPLTQSDDRAGYVIAYADTVDKAFEICMEVSRRIMLETR